MDSHQLVQHRHHAFAWQSDVGVDGQGFAIALVGHVKNTVSPGAVERIAYKIHGPRVVQLRDRLQRHLAACQHALLRPADQIELKGAVRAIDPLAVPAMPEIAQAIPALLETPPARLRDQRGQRRDDRRIATLRQCAVRESRAI
jgi:hypothetical protein